MQYLTSRHNGWQEAIKQEVAALLHRSSADRMKGWYLMVRDHSHQAEPETLHIQTSPAA